MALPLQRNCGRSVTPLRAGKLTSHAGRHRGSRGVRQALFDKTDRVSCIRPHQVDPLPCRIIGHGKALAVPDPSLRTPASHSRPRNAIDNVVYHGVHVMAAVFRAPSDRDDGR